jgi:uncharacterized 2Fe-2S/4Fe-4S cluster protein (DUF4445 family)
LLAALENLPYLSLNKSIQGTLQVAVPEQTVMKKKEITKKSAGISYFYFL